MLLPAGFMEPLGLAFPGTRWPEVRLAHRLRPAAPCVLGPRIPAVTSMRIFTILSFLQQELPWIRLVVTIKALVLEPQLMYSLPSCSFYFWAGEECASPPSLGPRDP